MYLRGVVALTVDRKEGICIHIYENEELFKHRLFFIESDID